MKDEFLSNGKTKITVIWNKEKYHKKAKKKCFLLFMLENIFRAQKNDFFCPWEWEREREWENQLSMSTSQQRMRMISGEKRNIHIKKNICVYVWMNEKKMREDIINIAFSRRDVFSIPLWFVSYFVWEILIPSHSRERAEKVSPSHQKTHNINIIFSIIIYSRCSALLFSCAMCWVLLYYFHSQSRREREQHFSLDTENVFISEWKQKQLWGMISLFTTLSLSLTLSPSLVLIHWLTCS